MDVEVSDLNLTKFKQTRTQLRRVATLSFNRLEALLKKDNPDVDLVEEEHMKTQDKVTRLFELDNKIEGLLLEGNMEDDEVDAEFDIIEKYRERWLALDLKKLKLDAKFKEDVLSSAGSSGVATPRKTRNIKLCKLQPKLFDGRLQNWISFWTMFSRIHEDGELGDDEKFQYLLQFTLEGSPARELLESFPPSDKNYPKAIDQLRKRFGRRGLLIKMYVRELVKVAIAQAFDNSKLPLRILYDKLESQLRALETLGVAKDDFASMLLPLVESSLPENVLREWERRRILEDNEDEETENMQIEPLLSFLRREVESEERIALARETFKNPEIIKQVGKEPFSRIGNYKCYQKNVEKVRGATTPTATDLINVRPQMRENTKCVFCEGAHPNENCYKARDMNFEDIQKVLKEKGCCFCCMRWGHTARSCKIKSKCIICCRRHHPLMCSERKKNSCEKAAVDVEHNLSVTNINYVLLQTLSVKVKGEREQQVRLLFDTGSQRSYISQHLVKLMNLQPLKEEKLSHVLFGGMQTEVKRHTCYKVRLASVTHNYCCNFEVLDSEKICSALPVAARGPWIKQLRAKGITLSDVEDGPIDVLVGADVAGKLLTGKRVTLDNGLVAIETRLGWTVLGKVNDNRNDFKTHINLVTMEANVTDLWQLDVLGIEDPVLAKSRHQENIDALRLFQENVTILEDGRYEVGLPWLEGHPPLPLNYELASKRLDSTLKKLKASGKVRDYENVFSEWLEKGIIEEVFGSKSVGHYLPHRPVFKEGGTTKIRPVFDASAKLAGHPSLNQCLTKGVNMIELLPTILLRFRLDRIGVTADVEKAFLQISLRIEDRDYLRFLWRDGCGNTRIFRHKRVVFGVSSSPFLLGAVIDYHLTKCKERADQGVDNYSSETIEKLQRGFYVDNCVTSLSDEDQLHSFIREATTIFNEARLNLRGWEYSEPNCRELADTPLLGLIWNRERDTLRLNFPVWRIEENSPLTRRILLSTSQQLFDVVGISCPTALVPKLLIQETWIEGGEWDTQVSEHTKRKFKHWVEEMPLLAQLEVPRWVRYSQEGSARSLHVFCDASQKAYAAVCFLRVQCSEGVLVYLIQAKARVAPIKKITIPRLELLAATIGARLASGVLEELKINDVTYWSDSATVLAWIKREEPWGVFVWNRVKEIRELTNPGLWRHVSGNVNPADLASRGCSPKILVQSKWWEGPEWLRLEESEWPSTSIKPDEEEVLKERKKSVISNACIDEIPFLHNIFHHFSKYGMLVRCVGWIIRFSNNCRARKEVRTYGNLSVTEIDKAEKIIIAEVQKETFKGTDGEKIKKLKPYLDSEGVLRVRTRIWARKDSEDFRSPVVLPTNHIVVEKIILDVHRRNGHIVGQCLLNELRERYWVVRGRQTIRRVIRKCAICQRYTAKPLNAETPPLPEARVRDARVFEVVGTDLAGPLRLKNGEKVWVCIFTCAVYRAVHLELVTSLSTESFTKAFRRFIARRGRPSLVYSDNGTNFRGFDNAFKNLDWERIATQFVIDKIEWRFNPPTAAWWGGFWERLIGILKRLLRKILGKASLTQEELETVVCESEALINARPISYMSEDNEDPVPISPKMFLQEVQAGEVPDFDLLDSRHFGRRVKNLYEIRKRMRERFRSEYLGQLRQPSDGRCNSREPKVGEVVLVGADNCKRGQWPLAIVEKLVSGKDGRCRLVELRSAEGKLHRPIQRIYPLEVFSGPDEPPAQTVEEPSAEKSEDQELKKTRGGRIVRLPPRLR